ncbi:MAG: hypothetical protein H7287_04095 [Thermoleophilia bacterium]|nr:hypothetical protein [Thermoleophilia bacterium]
MILSSVTSPTAAIPRPAGERRLPINEVMKTLEHTSAETLQGIPTPALAYPLGKGSLAGALNDAVRFRVVGDGPMSQRQLVPDSQAAQTIVDSKQGAKLLKILGTAVGGLDGHEKRNDLTTIILPKDVDSVVAAQLVQNNPATVNGVRLLDLFGMQGARTAPQLRKVVQDMRAELNESYKMGMGAYNQAGTIVFSPETARMLLTASGAYTPQTGDELSTVSAKYAADIVNHVPVHEAKHSVSPVSDALYQTPGKWLEEALAEVLSNTPAILARTAEQTGVNAHSYAGHLAHQSKVDLGWKGWHAQRQNAAETEQNNAEVGRNYIDSQQVFRDLLSNAGYSFGTAAQAKRTDTYLQTLPAEKIPDKLAQTLVSRWKIDPTRTSELSGRIASVIDDKGGVEQLRTDFGIAQD